MKRNVLTWTAMIVAMGTAIAVVAGAGGYGGPDYSDTGLRSLFFPKTDIVTLRDVRSDSTRVGNRRVAGLFDSTSGAVYSLRGNRANSSARVHWQLAIPAVSGTSGLLALRDITPVDRQANGQPRNGPTISLQQRQNVGDIRDGETFLVDLVTGNTWLFRLRTNTNQQIGTWDPVDVYYHGKNQSVANLLSSSR